VRRAVESYGYDAGISGFLSKVICLDTCRGLDMAFTFSPYDTLENVLKFYTDITTCVVLTLKSTFRHAREANHSKSSDYHQNMRPEAFVPDVRNCSSR